MARRSRLPQSSLRAAPVSGFESKEMPWIFSTRMLLLLKALSVWALFTVGGWIAIPLELVPLFSHCVGLGFYLVIVTQQARWLIPVSLGGFIYLGVVYFTVPSSAWAVTTHILGYAGLIILIFTHFCLKWVGADLQPQAERILENLKDALPSVDVMPTAERILEYLGPLLRDRLTLEHLLESISDGISGMDDQRVRALDWLIRIRLHWMAALTPPTSSTAASLSTPPLLVPVVPSLGTLLARALAMAADCPGGISSALGSTAEALLARLLSLYPKRCVEFLLDILAEEKDEISGTAEVEARGISSDSQTRVGERDSEMSDPERRRGECVCGLKEALLFESSARKAADLALEVSRCRLEDLEHQLESLKNRLAGFETRQLNEISETEGENRREGEMELETVEECEPVGPAETESSEGTGRNVSSQALSAQQNEVNCGAANVCEPDQIEQAVPDVFSSQLQRENESGALLRSNAALLDSAERLLPAMADFKNANEGSLLFEPSHRNLFSFQDNPAAGNRFPDTGLLPSSIAGQLSSRFSSSLLSDPLNGLFSSRDQQASPSASDFLFPEALRGRLLAPSPDSHATSSGVDPFMRGRGQGQIPWLQADSLERIELRLNEILATVRQESQVKEAGFRTLAYGPAHRRQFSGESYGGRRCWKCGGNFELTFGGGVACLCETRF